jgi:hypothetical protein
MNDIGHAVSLRSRENVCSGGDVVIDECLLLDCAELRVVEDEHPCAAKGLLPLAREREISLYYLDFRVETGKRLGIRRVLINADKPSIATLLEPQYEIVPDKARCTSD